MKKRNCFFLKTLSLGLTLLALLPSGLACTTEPSETTADTVSTEEVTAGTTPVTEEPEVGIRPTLDSTAKNGMCLVLPGAKQDTDILIDMMDVMNVQAVRLWMHATTVLESPSAPKASQTEKNKAWLKKLKEAGVTKIVAMSHYWFQPESIDISGMDSNLAHSAVLFRDPEDPLYQEWLGMFEQTWYTMANTYPEVTVWEVGGEVNADLYLHPFGYEKRKSTFTQDEKAEILTDMLYAASKGVHRANPSAVVCLPGLAPLDGFSGMANFLERVYKCVKSGKFGNGTTDTYCYFQTVAWHGYFLKTPYTLQDWLDGNREMYAVMEKYGDGEKKVLITEFGFSDGGDPKEDKREAGYYTEILSHLSDLPFIDSVYPFRLMEYRSSSNPDPIEIYYGIMRAFDKDKTHIGAKEKAKAICSAYGGDLNQLDKYLGENCVYPTQQ